MNPFRYGALALDEAFTNREDEIRELDSRHPERPGRRRPRTAPLRQDVTRLARHAGGRQEESPRRPGRPDDDADEGAARREARGRRSTSTSPRPLPRPRAAADLRRPAHPPDRSRSTRTTGARASASTRATRAGRRRDDRAPARAARRSSPRSASARSRSSSTSSRRSSTSTPTCRS